MTTVIPFTKRIFRANVSRLDAQGSLLGFFEGCVVRLTAATPPTAAEPLPELVEGLELTAFQLGDAPRLEIEVPIKAVNDYLRLLRGREGMRREDSNPLSAAHFAVFQERDFLRADVTSVLLVDALDFDDEGLRLTARFDAVDLSVKGSRQEAGIVQAVRVSASVQQDLLRDYLPVVGQAGDITWEQKQ